MVGLRSHVRVTDIGHTINRWCTLVTVTAGILCLWPVMLGERRPPQLFAEATTLPSAFTTTQTLTKLQKTLCASCTPKRKRCLEFERTYVCHLLCGCSDNGQKCLAEGSCTCPLASEEGCRYGSQTLCEFDDALVCSTSKEVCLYYDERKVHCECRDGWTGKNCETCSDESTTCKVDDKPDEPSVPGSAPTVKVLVACAACLVLGLLLGVFCMCRTGKLVCTAISRDGNNPKTGDGNQEKSCEQRNLPIARQQSEHQYCHIVQYAVPAAQSAVIRNASKDPAPSAGYTEPTYAKCEKTSISYRKNEGNYYFKLEPSSGLVMYESVGNRGNSATTSSQGTEDDFTPRVATSANHNIDNGSGTTESPPSAYQSCAVYDHLKRNVDANSDTTRNYSRIALQEFL